MSIILSVLETVVPEAVQVPAGEFVTLCPLTALFFARLILQSPFPQKPATAKRAQYHRAARQLSRIAHARDAGGP